ncbi:MAG: hypothetical protein JW801_01745 [Bacteroidales bacterium]|nr:hypothetical protein [Bacteroidales bacterium]
MRIFAHSNLNLKAMTDKALEQEFKAYFSVLTKSQKESILEMIKSFTSKSGRISVEQYNEELTAAEERIAKGSYVSHEDLEKEAEKW